MQIPINNKPWRITALDDIWAAFMFFTRLPLWRLHEPSKEAFSRVVEHWPLTGWLTGAVMGGTMYGMSYVASWPVAIVCGMAMRMLLTGALHEDGLADFIDGFGGVATRERTLEIMKDSHIGTYGVLGLIIYCALLFTTLLSLTPFVAMILVMCGDAFARMVAGQLVQMLPYARTAETAKNKVVYRRIPTLSAISLTVQGLLPMFLLLFINIPVRWEWMLFLPCLVMYAMYMLMRSRLDGYTGDCCGATYLLVELTFYIAATLNIQL